MSTPVPTCPNCLERLGFSLLDELCSSCFSELIIQPAMEASDLAIASWADAVDRRYRVECALGLRAAPEQNEERDQSATNCGSCGRIKASIIHDMVEPESRVVGAHRYVTPTKRPPKIKPAKEPLSDDDFE